MTRLMPVVAALLLSAFSLSASSCSKRGVEQQAGPELALSASAKPTQPVAKSQPSKTVKGLPPGFVEMTVGGVAPTEQGHAVLLTDEDQERAVPIFVGQTEALSIQLRLKRKRYSRPLTHDLMDDMLGRLGAKITSVRVEKLEDNVFYGVVVLNDGKKSSELDARSSDAIALALSQRAPIYVAKTVVEKAGISLQDLPDVEQVPTDTGQEDDSEPEPIPL